LPDILPKKNKRIKTPPNVIIVFAFFISGILKLLVNVLQFSGPARGVEKAVYIEFPFFENI
jgi:hypothetical protein